MIKLKDILTEAKGDVMHNKKFNTEKDVEKFLYDEWVPWTEKRKMGLKILYKYGMGTTATYHTKNKNLIWAPGSAKTNSTDCKDNLKRYHLNTKYAEC